MDNPDLLPLLIVAGGAIVFVLVSVVIAFTVPLLLAPVVYSSARMALIGIALRRSDVAVKWGRLSFATGTGVRPPPGPIVDVREMTPALAEAS